MYERRKRYVFARKTIVADVNLHVRHIDDRERKMYRPACFGRSREINRLKGAGFVKIDCLSLSLFKVQSKIDREFSVCSTLDKSGARGCVVASRSRDNFCERYVTVSCGCFADSTSRIKDTPRREWTYTAAALQFNTIGAARRADAGIRGITGGYYPSRDCRCY